MERRGKDFGEFKEVIRQLVDGQTLVSRYRDHVLMGPYKRTRECHKLIDYPPHPPQLHFLIKPFQLRGGWLGHEQVAVFF